jgi:hypothetical protein
MPEPSFTVQNCSDAEIRVAHVSEGHRYTFSFTTDNQGRRILSPAVSCRDNDKAAHSAEHFAKEARQFATTEAHKSGKID